LLLCEERPGLVTSSLAELEIRSQAMDFFIPDVVAAPIRCECSSSRFRVAAERLAAAKLQRYILLGAEFRLFRSGYDVPFTLDSSCSQLYNIDKVFAGGCLGGFQRRRLTNIEMVDFASLIADSVKLKYLDQMLQKLKKEGKRALIFCQMTRMIDILEDFMQKKKYLFLRLDGSSNITDRRDMVNEFQTNPKIFIFLLSTRAGGLGVTLTAADAVIFYDNDWNPTMDAQATDRAHRIGTAPTRSNAYW